jgi:Predicted Zn-dependent protease (DUF2268)
MIVYLFLDTESCQFFPKADRQTIQTVCDRAEPEIRHVLPRLPDTLELAAQTGTFVIPETGEVGSAVAPFRINWVVDPSRLGGIAAIAQSSLKPTLYHECHHLVRFARLRRPEVAPTLMDRVVGEGLATAFERDFSGRRPPWGDYPTDVSAWVEELMKVSESESIIRWMFWHPDGRRWIGYRAGTYIADRAISASGRSAAELVLTPYEEILEMARINA